MGLFTGIETAVPGGGGVYFLEGLYKVKLEKVFSYISYKKENLFIVETRVLESSVDARPPGMQVSWSVNMKHPSALGNIKGFVWAIAKDKTLPVTEADVEFMVSPANPLAGTELELECVTIITREKKQPFTRHDWAPIGGFPPGQ